MNWEDHKSRKDRMAVDNEGPLALGIIIAIVIAVGLILYTPDVEAIGTWVYELTH